MVAVVDRFYPSNAENAKRIHAVELFDDISDGDSIDDLTECDGDFVETREGDSESAEDYVGCYCCNDMEATDSCFAGMNKT
jgi:hypothetical protein